MLGFGMMRLPKKDGAIDFPQVCKMVDRYLDAGFNYFDTAHGYLNGQSEVAIQKCLTSRYPRERYVLTDKLSSSFFESAADVEPLADEQLAICGVQYFDYYLMHNMNAHTYALFVERDAFAAAAALKAKGKVRHIGISFHDKAELLDRILTEQPTVEVVQIQFNYRDYDDPVIQSGKCLEVCRKHGKPVFVMEPVRGGNLADLPRAARQTLDVLQRGSNASFALRYAASFDGVVRVLSGMSNEAQMEDNLKTMSPFKPLDADERAAIARVVEILRNQGQIPCTRCQYCTEQCPQHINIPRLFGMVNTKKEFQNANTDWDFMMATRDHGKPSACLGCGLCEQVCPQHIEIRERLKEIAAEYEK